MGESPEQHSIILLFLTCLIELANERKWANTFIGSNTFFQWVEHHPQVQVSPDVYLLDNVPGELPGAWQTWQPGVSPPRFALEIVSVNWKKDYEDGPERYASLGCRELVIFDPTAVGRRNSDVRRPLIVYRRGEDAGFVQVYGGDGPVFSEEIGAWLVARPENGRPRLRLSKNAAGTRLVESSPEAAQSARAALADEKLAREKAEARAETEARARAEAEARAEKEERARTAAEARTLELEAQLRRLQGGG